MAKGIKITAPIIEDITIAPDLDTNIGLSPNISNLTTTTYNIKDDIKELEKKVAELSLRVPRPRRRIKSIRIRF